MLEHFHGKENKMKKLLIILFGLLLFSCVNTSSSSNISTSSSTSSETNTSSVSETNNSSSKESYSTSTSSNNSKTIELPYI